MNSINNNFMALNVANTVDSHYGRLSTSVQRLSSGLRINSAADDPAGLAIRELMRSDVAALNQGMRNANDAISMLQTADGALAVIDEKLIRMKELAEQAATGTYDSTQRLMIDSEFQAMGAEIDRIARATDFNGIKLLDGSLSGAHNGSGLNSTGMRKIHFGAGNDSAEDYYYVNIDDCTIAGLGLGSGWQSFPDAPESMSWINDAKIDYAGRQIIIDIPDRFAGRSPAAFTTGLDYYSLPVGLENIIITSNAVYEHPFHKPHVCLFTKDFIQISGPPLNSTRWTVQTRPDGSTAIANANRNWWNETDPDDFLELGVEKGVFNPGSTYGQYSTMQSLMQPGGTGSTGTGLVVSTPTGMNEIGSDWSFAHGDTIDEIIELNRITDDLVFFIGGHDLPVYGCNEYRLRIEADITDEFLQKLKMWAGEGSAGSGGDLIHIDTQEKAQEALVRVNEAIVKKDEMRAHLGALQNRLENTVTNLAIQSENMQAAEARISDADVATEMTQFVRNQVLTQAAVAMLGQANSYPHMLAGLING